MAHHPLTQFVESILALKRYRFRQEDLINLLRTGLYTDLSQAVLTHLSNISAILVSMACQPFSKPSPNPTMESLI